MYNLNFHKWIEWLLVSLLRVDEWKKLFFALVKPVKSLYSVFLLYRKKINYKLTHNGQVCYLEAVLNDYFDISGRGITITEGDRLEPLLIHENEAEMPVLLGTEIIHDDSNYSNSGYDFQVNVPFPLDDGRFKRMRALLDYYKLAGKHYQIFTS